MKKYLILAFIAVAQMVSAQEARMFNINVEPLEIEGWGVLEGEIQTISGISSPSPRMQDPNKPIIERHIKKSTMMIFFTNSETKEQRIFKCESSDLDYLLKQFGRIDSLVADSNSVTIARTGIVKKTLTPPVTLSDDGVESTYTEEYAYECDQYNDGKLTIAVYTNNKGQNVWYYQFGDVSTSSERNLWRILANEKDKDSFVEWLEKIRKAM